MNGAMLAGIISGADPHRGSVGLKRDFEIALELVATGKAPVDRLVSHRFRLGDIEEAYRVAADKRTGAVKVLLDGRG